MSNESDKSTKVTLELPFWKAVVSFLLIFVTIVATTAYVAFELTKFGYSLQQDAVERAMDHSDKNKKEILMVLDRQNETAMNFMEEFRAERLASSNRLDEIAKTAYTTSR